MATFTADFTGKRVTTLVLRLCGGVALTSVEGPPTVPPLGAKPLALLAFLALEPGPHSREQITALLWGDYPEDKAKASLRQALTHLRDALGNALRVDRSVVELVDPPACDITEFRRLAQLDAPAATEIDVTRFLADLSVRHCPAFDEWVDAKRFELRRLYSQALGARVRGMFSQRAWRDARELAEKWSSLDPLADEPMAALVEA